MRQGDAMAKVRWLPDVAPHDYDAALGYLTLKLDAPRAIVVVRQLREAPGVEWRRANDVIRACQLPPLPLSDPGVKRGLRKIRAREQLSPVLVVSYRFGGDIADGYHRVSAVYQLDPFQLVPLRLAYLADAGA